MRKFETFHPVVLAVYFFAIIIPTMVLMDARMIAASIVTGICYTTLLDQRFPVKAILWGVIMTAVITLINALVSSTGERELLFINGRAVTMEGILYGVQTGTMLAAAFLWFGCMTKVLTGEKILSIFAGLFKFGLIMTMVMRLLPRYFRRFEEVAAAEKINRETAVDKTSLMKNASAVFTWALENSMQTAVSMQMRGFDNEKRTKLYPRMKKRDWFCLLAVGILQCGYIKPVYGTAVMIGILGFFPILYRIKEELRWLRFKRKA